MGSFPMKRVLTIAGSDSGGGAGIQADLKTFFAHGVYGMSAITAITAQNTRSITDIIVLPAPFVKKQIDVVMKDIGADAWETGMLGNSAIVHVVADRAAYYKVPFLVVDPVMIAKTGTPLLQKGATVALVKKLLPLAFVVTPNIPEGEVLSGIKITTIDAAKKAAVLIAKSGVTHVVIKGGHRRGNDVIDILFDGKRFHAFSSPRIQSTNTHGTGSVFAASLAAQLAKGKSIHQATRLAKQFVEKNLRSGRNRTIGHGTGPFL